MKKLQIRRWAAWALAQALMAASGCAAPADSGHEGMAYVNTGGAMEWITPAEGVAVSTFSEEEFTAGADGWPEYTGEGYEVRRGVDVSFYQGEIDWESVKAAGIDFAMIRCGYRGSETGQLVEDEQFRNNIDGAIAAGLDVGVYFFSQSTGAVEAAEEAMFVLGLIDGYELNMPVAFDWEPIEGSRAEDIDRGGLTAGAVVFCEMIKDAGYVPAVYMYRYIGYYEYELSRLADYELWLGAPGAWPDFYYEHQLWQFSYTGQVDGIPADVDLNLQFLAVPDGSSEAPQGQ